VNDGLSHAGDRPAKEVKMTDEAAAQAQRYPVELSDFAAAAQQRLPKQAWDYLDAGAGTESMVNANRAVLDRVWLRPQVLTGTVESDTTTNLLNTVLAAPMGVAPMAHQRLFHPEGEVAAARAAGEAGLLFIASIFASRTIEDMTAATKGPVWQQLYWLRRRDEFERFLARAEDAGVSALVLTVDTPVVARRPRDARNAFVLPPDVQAVNLDAQVMQSTHEAQAGSSAIARHAAQQFQPGLGWSDLAWLRQRTQLPLLLKGVLSARDATLAVEQGVDGVIVSNHGGRQLDGSVPSAYALPEIANAVGNRCAVLVDGAFRQGHDVLKALVLGAHTVLIGRPVIWGLAHDGAEGARAVLDLLRTELAEAMLLSGIPSIAAASTAEFVSDLIPPRPPATS
jgi:4-hydroxymandelate oxidase